MATTYKARYEKLCNDIKQKSRGIRFDLRHDRDVISDVVRTTTKVYDRIVDKS